MVFRKAKGKWLPAVLGGLLFLPILISCSGGENPDKFQEEMETLGRILGTDSGVEGRGLGRDSDRSRGRGETPTADGDDEPAPGDPTLSGDSGEIPPEDEGPTRSDEGVGDEGFAGEPAPPEGDEGTGVLDPGGVEPGGELSEGLITLSPDLLGVNLDLTANRDFLADLMATQEAQEEEEFFIIY